MINSREKQFPLPENAESLNIKQLTELINNDEFLNHYVINKSYHEYNEVIKFNKEIERLKAILAEIKEISSSLSKIDDSSISSKIPHIEDTTRSLQNQMAYMNTELTTDNIKHYLEVYLSKIQKAQIHPLQRKILEDPYDEKNHNKYLETLTKFNKLKTLFNSLST